MKKVLILTCYTGEGHNSAAKALQSAFEKQGNTCEMLDPISLKSDTAQHMVSACYNNMIRKRPSLFGAIYRLGEMYSSAHLPSPVYLANTSYARDLRRYIEENCYDVVVCTHLYGMEAMTAVLPSLSMPIPCYGVLTDYVCIPFVRDTRLTGYFVPHEGMRRCLIHEGIPESSVHITGIPVLSDFAKCVDRQDARQQLGLHDEEKMYLIMTGGVGCENMESLCSALLDKVGYESKIVVMTGRNREMKERLDQKYSSDGRLETVPFTPRVALFMAAADVLLSKPGGLSSTEAAALCVPMVHIHAIPGCETYNAKFFSERGMSVWAKNEQEAVQQACDLVRNTQRARQMMQMQRVHINPNAAAEIVQEVCGA